MINLSFSIEDLQLRPDQAEAAQTRGTLDEEQVYFQYLCSTASGHEPDEAPDDRVRASHAALHGTIWRIDDPNAPIPPLGFGCRCGMRYCGAPGTVASVVLGATAEEQPTTLEASFAEWLGANLPGWEKYAADAKDEAKPDRLGAIYLALKADGVSGDLRELARMILSAVTGR